MKNKVFYLDNAATSFPKPKSVASEVKNCLESYCGNAGRGSNRLALRAANKIYECREAICSLVGAKAPEDIVFVPSCTYGLNLIIHGLLRAGDHVLISDMEHNAVLRPIYKLAREKGITYDVFPALSSPRQSDEELLRGIQKRIKDNTKLLICNHQSNICSYSLPISKIGALCKKNNIIFAIDTAQSMGHYEIDVQKMNVDFIVAPAHKGLYGLQGCAFAVINSTVVLDTLTEGGNGINSLLPEMPDFAPERYEVGTLPLPCIVGLHEGIKFVNSRGINELKSHEDELFCQLRDELLNIGGITVYCPDAPGSTLSFNVDGVSFATVCAAIDEANVCVRGGFHCSALAHRSLGTEKIGAVRVSFGAFNTIRDVEQLIRSINGIAKF